MTTLRFDSKFKGVTLNCMPKKFANQNSKAVEATARKNAAKESKRIAEERAIEDALWEDNDKHVKRKEDRKLAKEQKKNDKLEKKLENTKLLEEEEAKLGGNKNATSTVSNKMTRHDILVAQQQTSSSGATDGMQSRGDDDDDFEIERNMNREIGINDTGARNVDEAIAQLTEGDSTSTDQHPEKRMKAALKAYEKSRLPMLKGEQPGLRLSQYKEIIWKEFQKSPQNPLNQ